MGEAVLRKHCTVSWAVLRKRCSMGGCDTDGASPCWRVGAEGALHGGRGNIEEGITLSKIVSVN